jgi:hypothetical protein
VNHVLTILQKILTREFYRTNASLFLIVLGLGVGFMKGEDHAMLAEIIVGSPFLTIIPFAVWMAYSFLIVDFNQRTISRSENDFVYHYILFPPTRQRLLVLGVVFMEFLPAIAYGGFLILAGIKFRMWLSTALLFLSLLIFILSISALLRRALCNPGRESQISRLSQLMARVVTRPYVTFSLEGLLRKQPFSVLGCKLAGFAVVWASLALYSTDVYDFRLLGLGIALGISFNAATISEWHYFDNVSFGIVRALPISLADRCMKLLIALMIFLLPEIGLIVSNFPEQLHWYDGAGAVIFASSIPFLAYSFMFTKAGASERFTTFHFAVTLTWVVLILSRLPLAILGAVNFGLGFICWKKSYYSYEYGVKSDDAS